MSTQTVVALLLLAVAGACELLAAFGIDGVGAVALVPLGLVFLIAALAIRAGHRHAG